MKTTLVPSSTSSSQILLLKTTLPRSFPITGLIEKLLNAHLVACAQFVPLQSHYHWLGKLESSEEYLLMLKTTPACLSSLLAMLSQEHPYELPEISWELLHTTERYAQWVWQSVNSL